MGLPFLTRRVKKDDFSYITRRLASWKEKVLNRAGRVTLANSMLLKKLMALFEALSREVLIFIMLNGMTLQNQNQEGVLASGKLRLLMLLYWGKKV